MISAVVITRNEEEMIGDCLEALLQVTDDIVIVDSGSTDKTEEICKAKGVRFFPFGWKGFSENKNFGNQEAKYDWILSIDADEVVSKELVASILQEIKAPAADAYDIKFLNNFCGKWLYYGSWAGESHVRLFNKKGISWKGDIHESLTLEGKKVGKLKGFINHYSMKNLEKYIIKTNNYTTLAAEDMFKRGKKAGFTKIYLAPCFRFFSDYVLRLGFLDGFHGYLIAIESAHYVFIKYSKLRLLHFLAQSPR